MKKLLPLFISPFVFVTTASAFVMFTGGSDLANPTSNDLADYVNNYTIDSSNVSSSPNYYFDAFPIAEGEAPKTAWVGVGDYYYNDGTENVFYYGQKDLVVSHASGWSTIKGHTVFRYSEDNAQIKVSLGSKDKTGKLEWYNHSIVIQINPTATITFERATDAGQTYFYINAASNNSIKMNSGTAIMGTLATGALDRVGGGAFESFNDSHLEVYTKLLTFTYNATMKDNSTLTYVVAEPLIENTPIMTVGGVLKKTEGSTSTITFDFSNVEILEGEYTLMTIGSLTGFDVENTFTDFVIEGLDSPYELSWNDLTTPTELRLSVLAVPEPATVAALMGALALGFVVYRRRK